MEPTTAIRKYEPSDYEAVIHLELKEKDQEEVIASTGESVGDILDYICNNEMVGEKFVLVHKGNIEGVLGVVEAPTNPKHGIVYFLSTDKIYDFKYAFIKYSRAVIDLFLKKYEVLTNYTLADYDEAIEWLTYIGAKWDDTEYILSDPDTPFKYFYFTRS